MDNPNFSQGQQGYQQYPSQPSNNQMGMGGMNMPPQGMGMPPMMGMPQGNMGGGMQFNNMGMGGGYGGGDGGYGGNGGDDQQDKYKTALCNNFSQTGNCKYGDNCKFAHGEEELRSPAQSYGGQRGGYRGSSGGRGGPSRGGFGGGRGGGFGGGRGGGDRGGMGGGRPQVCNQFASTGTCGYGDRCKFMHEV